MHRKMTIVVLVSFIVICMLNLMVSMVAGIHDPGGIHPTPIQQFAYVIAVNDYGYDDAGARQVATWALGWSLLMMLSAVIAPGNMLREPQKLTTD